MVQSVLADPDWVARLSSDDLRGLSPLIYTHINPYGRFEVDSTGALTSSERPHERHYGYTHSDGSREHPEPPFPCSFRVDCRLMYRAPHGHTQNEQFNRPHWLRQGLDRGPEPRCSAGNLDQLCMVRFWWLESAVLCLVCGDSGVNWGVWGAAWPSFRRCGHTDPAVGWSSGNAAPKLDQAPEVVGEVGHPDLGARPGQADRPDHQSHRLLLHREHVLDRSPRA